jgi:hypothetical protein
MRLGGLGYQVVEWTWNDWPLEQFKMSSGQFRFILKLNLKKKIRLKFKYMNKKNIFVFLKTKQKFFDGSSSILHVSDGCMEPFIARVPSRSPKLMIPIPSYIMAFPSAEKIILKINFKFFRQQIVFFVQEQSRLKF